MENTLAPTEQALQADLHRLAHIPFLPQLLEVVCAATGMGFAAVARVTRERWIAGMVKDDIAFGLVPGSELPVASTICHEIRENVIPVVIDHVAHDTAYRDHHTPAMYGLQSYISFPIVLKDGSFFGTLCAIDKVQAMVKNPYVMNLFTLLSSVIAEYLDGVAHLPQDKLNKLASYASAELKTAQFGMHTELIPVEAIQARIALVSMKMKLLLIALNPKGSFLR